MEYQDLFSLLKQTNKWWDDPNYRINLKKRDLEAKNVLGRGDKLIDIFIGPRRVGKTYLMYSLINQLLDSGVSPKQIIFISAELPEVNSLGLREHIEQLKKVLSGDGKFYIFIDEVQELENWEIDLKIFFDLSEDKYFVSGSSSLALSEGAGRLAGRFVLHKVMPLNFGEYIRFSGDEELENYLKTGGYPEYVLNQDRNPTYLKQLADTTLYRDLLSGFGIRNPEMLKNLLSALADKSTTSVSYIKLAGELGIDEKTVAQYIEYLKAIYFIYPVRRKAASHKKSKGYSPKYYFNDTGVLNLYNIRPRLGHLLENAVFLKLLAQSETESYEIYYENVGDSEIDFVTPQGLYEVKARTLTLDELIPLVELELPAFLPFEYITIIMPGVTEDHINFSPRLRFIEPVDFLLGRY